MPTYQANVSTAVHNSKFFVCILTHDSLVVGGTSEPGVGATWQTYWKEIGGSSSLAQAVLNEEPSGVINGLNAVFVLAAVPVLGSVTVYKNGVRMNPGVGNDYTLSTDTITFAGGQIPQVGDIVLADYWVTSSALFSFNEVPSGLVNGINVVYTLANTPVNNSLTVYKNGIRMFPGVGNDYVLSGNTITFTGTQTPQSGDVLLADYWY